MSDAFESIKQGLKEAIQYAEGKCPGAVVHYFPTNDHETEISTLQTQQYSLHKDVATTASVDTPSRK